MEKTNTIVITGAAGFIGSCLVSFLNENGFTNLILVDDFSREDKISNLTSKRYLKKIERETFFEDISPGDYDIDFIFRKMGPALCRDW